MHLRKLAFALILIAASGTTARAQLKSAPLDLQVFRPAMDSKGFITLNASQILGQKDFSFGLVSTWAHEPLAFSNPNPMGGTDTFKVTNLITPSFQAAVGLFQLRQVGLELGVTFPVGVMSGRGTPDQPATPGANDSIHYSFSGQGAGDLTIHPKLRLANASRNKWGIAVIPSLVLPTGDDKNFLGEGKTIFQPSAALDVELGRPGVFRIGVNGGLRMRGSSSTFTDDAAHFTHTVTPMPGAAPVSHNTGKGITIGNEALAGIGLSWGVLPQRFDIVGEFYSFIGLDSKKENGDKIGPGGEAIAGIKLYLARNSFFLLGGGYGVMPTSYGTTKGRAFVGFIFEPSIGDRDGDGLKDDVDLCPDDPEDFDDFEDEDGCPDPDNDKDKILDVDDKCPNDPETYNGFQDEDGCPDSKTSDRDGDGIPDDVDKCPDDPEDKDGFEDEDGCPDPDNDKDKILDVNDLCPNDPEDYDGFEDKDGCPDPDNDKDRILDVNDKCPNEPETYNGFEDDDGCPDKGKVIVKKGKLEILDKIYFETDKTIIKPVSFPLLDAIAATIKGNPELQLIEIQGHADERGSDEHNMELTDGRAHSVMEAMIERGVNPGTLRAKGYGETKPICTQHNEDCWSQNRRVEFIILRRADAPLLQGGEGQ